MGRAGTAQNIPRWHSAKYLRATASSEARLQHQATGSGPSSGAATAPGTHAPCCPGERGRGTRTGIEGVGGGGGQGQAPPRPSRGPGERPGPRSKPQEKRPTRSGRRERNASASAATPPARVVQWRVAGIHTIRTGQPSGLAAVPRSPPGGRSHAHALRPQRRGSQRRGSY